MARSRIEYSESARADLRELRWYIAERDGENRAKAAIARITKTIDILSFMPRMGTYKPYLEPGQRSFSVRPWVIIYDPLPEGIAVLRVLDGRRDLRALFESPQKP